MTSLPDPISRRDRQRQTREALIFAARTVFARDGYHGANLDLIAREAGFSKGAVYSNFAGKAALFLAVMDQNMAAALADGGDVFATSSADDLFGAELSDLVKGFALATLEFVAVTARDAVLSEQLGQRIRALTEGYTAVARDSRGPGGVLTDGELGALLTALDQGAALLTLAGGVTITQHALRAGMQRLLDPARSLEAEAPDG